jgi:SAM-dependent methyltransferase
MSIFDNVYRFFQNLKSGTEHLCYGRPILRKWALSATRPACSTRILDLGCGLGDDLAGIAASTANPVELLGVEGWTPYRETCASKGITTVDLDIERDALPFADASFDVVMANQVLEHAKDLFWILGEVSRVLKPGGLFLVGVPNMATWHDRLLLVLGHQPSSNKVLGPHVRGFTIPGFSRFATTDGHFTLEAIDGSGFYPFPEGLAKLLARIFPSLATGIFFRLRRTSQPGCFLEVLKARRFETSYYRGPSAT